MGSEGSPTDKGPVRVKVMVQIPRTGHPALAPVAAELVAGASFLPACSTRCNKAWRLAAFSRPTSLRRLAPVAKRRRPFRARNREPRSRPAPARRLIHSCFKGRLDRAWLSILQEASADSTQAAALALREGRAVPGGSEGAKDLVPEVAREAVRRAVADREDFPVAVAEEVAAVEAAERAVGCFASRSIASASAFTIATRTRCSMRVRMPLRGCLRRRSVTTTSAWAATWAAR